jgi:ATP-dependent helicase HrpA
MLARAADDVTASGATTWTFGSIPETVERAISGVPVTGYPALVDRGRSVDLAVLADAGEAQRTHLRGVRRLVALAVPNPAPRGHAALDMTGKLILGRYPHGGAQALLDDCADACIDAQLSGPPVRDEQAFAAAVSRITLELPRRYAGVLAQVVTALGLAWDTERAADALTSPVVADSVADIHAELTRFVGPRPVSRIGADHLPDLRCYLQAVSWRASKLPDDPMADAQRLRAVRAGEAMMAHGVAMWPVPDPRAADDTARSARRMIDEYRVSLFAQHIRTSVPVSERRIEKFVAGIRP